MNIWDSLSILAALVWIAGSILLGCFVGLLAIGAI